MAQYEVVKRLYDNINGIILARGQFVETEDDLWIARMGNALRARIAPDHITLVHVVNTVEGSKKAKPKEEEVNKVEEPKEEEVEKEEAKPTGRAKVAPRGGNKAVLGNDSNAK